MTTPRTGKRPLSFTGKQLASATSRLHAGKERNRWHTITVHETDSKKFVVAVQYHTQWEGESGFDDAVVLDTLEAVAVLLEEYIFPNLGSIGFPARDAYAERQAKLMLDLEQAFQVIVGEVLETLGCVESV